MATQIGYLSGVTSDVQTQLNGKADLSGATFTGSISANVITGNALLTTQQANTPTGTSYAWNLSNGNALYIILTSSTGNVTVTTSNPTEAVESILTVRGHGTNSRDITITQVGVTFYMTGKTSGNRITLDTLTANQRAHYRLFWYATTACIITRMALV